MSISRIPNLLNRSPAFRYVLTGFLALAGLICGFLLPLRLSLPLRYDFFLPLVFAFLLLWAAWRLPHPLNQVVSVFFTLILFSGALAALWRMGTNGVYEVLGLLPWFDAKGYYSEALQLLDGFTFSEISARRPLFTGFFSVLLFFTGKNLRLSLFLLTGLAGLVTWLISQEVNRTEKSAVLPALLTCGMFFFFRCFSGDVLTENLGFILGALGILLLWRSANNQNLLPMLAGLFCFSLAMNARPGAVLTLPLLILWVGFALKTRHSVFIRILFATGVIVLAFLVNSLLTSIMAPGVSASFSNFAQTFYGMADGGMGWTEVYRDHPEVFKSKDEGQIASQIYQISMQILKEHPENLLIAAQRTLRTFFGLGYYSAFNYFGSYSTSHSVNIKDTPAEFIIRLSATLLWLGLLPAAWLKRKDRRFSLLAALNLGVFFSLPFAPPWDAENMRAYAVSIPGMLLAVGMVLQLVLRKGEVSEPQLDDRSIPLNWLTIIILVLVLILPVGMRYASVKPSLSPAMCPAGQDMVATRVFPGSTVSVGRNPNDPFAIPYARFQKDLDQFPDAVVGQGLKSIPEFSRISQQNNALRGNKTFWLVGPIDLIREDGRLSVYCGKWSADPRIASIFLVSSVLP